MAAETGYHIRSKFAHLLGAQGIREVLNQAFMIYLARALPLTFGDFSLALGMGYIIMFVAEFGLNQPLVGMLADAPDQRGRVLSRALAIKGSMLSASILVMLGFVHWQDYSSDLRLVVIFIAAGCGLEAVASTTFVDLQVRDRQDREGVIRSLASIAGFGYGLVAIFLGAPAVAVALFKLIESCFQLVGGAFVSLHGSSQRLAWPRWKNIVTTARAGLIFACIGIAAITYNKANLFFLKKYAGSEGVAQYSATWLIVDGLAILVSNLLLRNVLYPLFVRLWGREQEEFNRLARDAARWLLGAALVLMFALAVESHHIIGLVYGDGYAQAGELQPWLVPTIIFAFLHNLASYLMMSMRRQKLLLSFYAAGLVINLTWCSLVIPAWPLYGAAGAMVVTKGCVALLSVGYCQLRLKLISGARMVQLLLGVALGAGLYFLLSLTGVSLLAEAAALAPMVWLAIRWYREFQGRA
jgi:O-antigen/teichoic acid export membrane protein